MNDKRNEMFMFSDISDSEMSDCDVQNLAKKPKIGNNSFKSPSRSEIDSDFISDIEDRKMDYMAENDKKEDIFRLSENREIKNNTYKVEKKFNLQKEEIQEMEHEKTRDKNDRSQARRNEINNKIDKKSTSLDELRKEVKKVRHNSSSSSSSSTSSTDRSHRQIKQITIKPEEMEKVWLSRDKLERWCHLPYFSNIVKGCFVRISIGVFNGKSVYRVGEIMETCETEKVYQIGKTRTNKGLKVRHGRDIKTFRMMFVSNSIFTVNELKRWTTTLMSASMSIPSTIELKDIEKKLEKAMTDRLSNSDINHMVKEKERFMLNPKNFAKHKLKLMSEAKNAKDKGENEKLGKLIGKLEETEEKAEKLRKKKGENASSVAVINDRNKKTRLAIAEKAIKEEMARKKLEGDVNDPFTRRKTQPVLTRINENCNNIQASDNLGKLEAEEEKNALVKSEDIKTEIKKEDKVHMFLDDMFKAHDFEIAIDLSLLGPSKSMDLIVEPMVNVKENNCPRKSLSLIKYKRSRGLF